MSTKITKNTKVTDLGFRVHTPLLLKELADNGIGTAGVLFVPINQLRICLGLLAERAAEINDPILNIRMLCLGLYDVPPMEFSKAIEQQIALLDE